MNDHFLSNKYNSYQFKLADIISTGNNTKIKIYKDDYYLSLEEQKSFKQISNLKNDFL
jgi:hypothetical protein